VAETDNLNKSATTVKGDVEIVYHLARKKVRVYYCPDERPNHYNPGNCRHLQCGSGRAIDSYVDEQELRMVVIQKQTIFNHQLCIQGRQLIESEHQYTRDRSLTRLYIPLETKVAYLLPRTTDQQS